MCTLHAHELFRTQEIAGLTVGKIVVIQTQRNNQVAFLKRLPDKNEIPAVQVCKINVYYKAIVNIVFQPYASI